MDFTETMFYAEMEGVLPTRFGKINKVISLIKKESSESIDEEHFNNLCFKVGLDPNSISFNEMNYILKSIK